MLRKKLHRLLSSTKYNGVLQEDLGDTIKKFEELLEAKVKDYGILLGRAKGFTDPYDDKLACDEIEECEAIIKELKTGTHTHQNPTSTENNT